MHKSLLLACLGVILSVPALWAADSCNPAPAPGDLVIPGPGGVCFAFRPVAVPSQGGPLGGKPFLMGDPSGDFRAAPTKVLLDGAFPAGEDQNSRIYYIGKYEVTEAQYAAVMGPDAVAGRTPNPPDYPVTDISWFDALRFTDKLNTWLYADKAARESLPTAGPFPAFVRLPMEMEWEYAARGGSAVEAVRFDAETPYDDNLAEYEWFSGPSSSHNKLQAVGKLKPNPLGLHDMLGNAREMTQSNYYIEYYQGRGGGFVARGGHYLVEEDDILSSLRTEEPFYLGSAAKGMKANHKVTMGFRLALSAPVLTDRNTIAEIADAWDAYRSGVGADSPAAMSTAPVGKQESVPAREALTRLARIKEELQKAGLASKLGKEIAATEAALRYMAQIRKKADEDSAKVWAKLACERGMYLVANLKGLAIASEAPSEHLRRRAEQYSYNITNGLDNYSEIMTELAKLPPEAVAMGFDAYANSMNKKIGAAAKSFTPQSELLRKDLTAQLGWMNTTRGHYEKYYKEKRFDAAAWQRDYAPK
jgi:formylglycine-generating enzyme required for sulfatase activity